MGNSIGSFTIVCQMTVICEMTVILNVMGLFIVGAAITLMTW